MSQPNLHIHVYATFLSFFPRSKFPSLVIKVSHEWCCYRTDFQATMSLKTGKCHEPEHETWQPGWLTWLSAWEKQPVKKWFWVAPTKPTSSPSCQRGSRQGRVWGRSWDSGRFSTGPPRPKENSEKPWCSEKLQSILLLPVAALCSLGAGPLGSSAFRANTYRF